MIKSVKAFSLIELLITLLISAILSLLCIAAYQSYVLRSYRAETIATLLKLATDQEQYYANHGTYSDSFAALGATAEMLMPRYKLTITLSENEHFFEIIADAYGAQLEDEECLRLTFNQAGQRNKNDMLSQHCWQ